MRHRGTPEDRRRWHLKHAYGITPEQHDAMLAEQAGACAICDTPLGSDPHVDHCHETKEVRGLLCRTCNLGLGHFKDNTARLSRAIAYLSKRV